jgi:Fe-S-cluster-containing dehydrogenase component
MGPARGGSVGKYGFVVDQRKCVGCHTGDAAYASVTPRFVPHLRRRLAVFDVAVRGET